MLKLDSNRKREILTLVVVFVIVLGISAFAVYSVANKTAQNEAARQSTTAENANTPERRTVSPADNQDERRTLNPADNQDEPFLDRLFGVPASEAHMVRGENWVEVMARITLRLLLAALLGAALAFRPRTRLRVLKRNPYVAQTQILLAIVAAALMIIVGNNAARAFGIFAAVSVVRFRTNIRDPKEITVLLISLAVGLAAGVGRWDLALVLCVFALLVLWVLEFREATQVTRAMDLKITTRNVAATQEVLREILKRHGFDSELRGMEQEKPDGLIGSLVYSVDLSPVVTTDDVSEEILALDKANVGSIEWEQKKSFSYIYQ
jgi:uncharacterized membrane protein YhiD involved in acid resistance